MSVATDEETMGGVGDPAGSIDRLETTALRHLGQAEEEFGIRRGRSGVTVRVRGEAFGATVTIDRDMRDEEEKQNERTVMTLCNVDMDTSSTLATVGAAIHAMVENARGPIAREAAWRSAGEDRAPHWSYCMHPVHRALLGSRLPGAHMLHAHAPGIHRTVIAGLIRQHGIPDGPDTEGTDRRMAKLSHVRGVIAVEGAAVKVGDVEVEIGGADSTPWLRLLEPLPETLRTALWGRRLGDLVETGCPLADATTIQSVIPGVRGDRIILEDVLTPLADAPEGVDTSWMERRHADVAERFRNAARPD